MEKMKCLICGGKPKKTAFSFTEADKYEKWVGIEKIKRLWVVCDKCGFHWQLRNYPLSHLESIYVDGYRNADFRKETIAQAHHRIKSMAYSENDIRYYQFTSQLRFSKAKNLLDIGSGIGNWPAVLKTAGYNVTCVESNIESINFIYDTLGIKCYAKLEDVDGNFDTVSLIHILEHIEDVDGFLGAVRKNLRPNGYLLVEVPDASEFKYLSRDHDDFNSCHCWFFDMSSLWRLLSRNGFKPKYAKTVEYRERGLTRLMMICQ